MPGDSDALIPFEFSFAFVIVILSSYKIFMKWFSLLFPLPLVKYPLMAADSVSV